MRVTACTPEGGAGGGDRSCVLREATGIMDVMTQHQDSSEPHNSHHDGWRQSGCWPNSLSAPPPLLFFITRTQTDNAQESTLISRSTDPATFQEKKIHQYVLVNTTTLSSLFRPTSYCTHSCVLQAAIPPRLAPSSARSFPGPLEESF